MCFSVWMVVRPSRLLPEPQERRLRMTVSSSIYLGCIRTRNLRNDRSAVASKKLQIVSSRIKSFVAWLHRGANITNDPNVVAAQNATE